MTAELCTHGKCIITLECGGAGAKEEEEEEEEERERERKERAHNSNNNNNNHNNFMLARQRAEHKAGGARNK